MGGAGTQGGDGGGSGRACHFYRGLDQPYYLLHVKSFNLIVTMRKGPL